MNEKIKLLDENRNCFNCIHAIVCIGFGNMQNQIVSIQLEYNNIPVNAPINYDIALQGISIYLANACLEFKSIERKGMENE